MPRVCPECNCFTDETRQAADGEIYCLDCATLVDDRLRSSFDATPPRLSSTFATMARMNQPTRPWNTLEGDF